jgi:V/A-type H+-transporting ATPase subunit I
MIKEMAKVQIIGPRSVLDDCVAALHALCAVHIEETPIISLATDAVEFSLKIPVDMEKEKEKAYLGVETAFVKELIALLPQSARPRKVVVERGDIHGLVEKAGAVKNEVTALLRRISELKDSLSIIEKYEKLLRAFAPVVPRLGGFKNFDITGLTIEKKRSDAIKLLEAETARITGGSYRMFAIELDEATAGVVLAYQSKFSSKIREMLSGRPISEMTLPAEYGGMPLLKALAEMERKKAEMPGFIRENTARLNALSNEWLSTLAGLLRAMEDAIDEFGVLESVAGARFSFAITGYVPLEFSGALRERLFERFGGKVVVRELVVKEEERDLIPVLIYNPAFLRPFEVFLSAVPLPKYGSVDPTPYIAIFFPAFFGLIVGDVGYGAVIFILSLWLRRHFKENEARYNITKVLTVSSLSAILFGFFFGEFFGDLGARLLPVVFHPLFFHRAESLKTFLILTAGIGAGHVVLGLIVGGVNLLHRGRRREAGVKATHIAVLLAFFMCLAAIAGYLPRAFFTPALLAVIAGSACLVLLEGVLGPLESIKALGSILSYVRLMAVGAASVVMATAANRMSGKAGSLVVGILMAGAVHIINIMLSLLSPSIQSMRLQYVEFFGKFYEGGGRRYKPFKKR